MTLFRGIVLALASLSVSSTWAQEKQHVRYQIPAENTKYVQQHVIDVGDVTGHQIRILELTRTYPKGTLAFAGVNVVREWGRGISDYINGSGRNWGYITWELENGDKVYGQWDANSQTVFAADGSKKASGLVTETIVGGTGTLAKIRGTLLGSYNFDPGRGINSGQWEGDYWLE